MYLIREPPKYMRQKFYKNDPKIGNASIVEDFNLMFIMDRTTREKINRQLDVPSHPVGA